MLEGGYSLTALARSVAVHVGELAGIRPAPTPAAGPAPTTAPTAAPSTAPAP
jgi:acetoin utilization deacetylase AcuC-like enzyme